MKHGIKKINKPADNYIFKVNNENSRLRCEICSKLTPLSSVFRFVIHFYQYVALLKVLELPYIMEIGRVFHRDVKPQN